MPPSICARMTLGLTATPQSTAHQTLCTCGTPSSPTRDLDDLRDIGVEALDAPRRRARGLPAPAEPQSAISATFLQHAGVARLVAEQREPALDRILAGLLQQFVDEGLDGEAGVGVADRAPPQRRHRQLGVVRDRRAGSGSRRAGSAAPSTEVASRSALPMIDWPTIVWSQAMILPSASIAPFMRVHVHRPVEAAADVVLARPHVLDRPRRRRSPRTPPPPRCM